MNILETLKKEYNKVESTTLALKDFSLVIGTVLVAIGFAKMYPSRDSDAIHYMSLGLVVLVAGIFFPKALAPFQKMWMVLAFILNKIVTTAILFVMFICIFIPIGLFMKFIMKKEFLESIDSSQKSYWNLRKKTPRGKESYQSQF